MKHLLLFLILFQVTITKAQWKPVENINSAICSDVIVCDSDVFISAAGLGILKQAKNENSWQLMNNMTAQRGIILIEDKIILKPDYNDTHNLTRSFDKGITWETLQFDTIQISNIFSVGNKLFAYDHILQHAIKSSDYGSTWQIENLLPVGYFSQITSDQEHLFLYSSDSLTRILVFDPETETLDSVKILGPLMDMQTIENGYIGVGHWFIYFNRQTNSVSGEYNEHNIERIEKAGSDLFGISFTGIYKYNPSDSSWISCNSGIENRHVNSIVENAGKYLITTDGGCYTSGSDFQWIGNSIGLNGSTVNDIKTLDNDVWACTTTGLYKSVDKGENFMKVLDGNFTKMTLSQSAIYVASPDSYRTSEDKGITWEVYNYPFIEEAGFADADFGGGYVYVIGCCQTENKLFRSLLKSSQWEEVEGSDLYFPNHISALDSIVLISCASSSLIADPVYISYNYGLQLQPISLFQDSYWPYSTISNGRIFVWFNSILYFSDDGAQSWQTANLNGSNYIEDIDFTNNQLIIASWTYNLEPIALVSKDNGNTFVNVTDNLQNALSYILSSTSRLGSRVFVGTYFQGLWYRDDLLKIDENQINSTDNQLIINPNPNVGEFSIQTRNLIEGEGSLRIFDAEGKLRSLQQIEFYHGKSQVKIAAELGSGIYLLKLDFRNNEHLATKMIIN